MSEPAAALGISAIKMVDSGLLFSGADLKKLMTLESVPSVRHGRKINSNKLLQVLSKHRNPDVIKPFPFCSNR